MASRRQSPTPKRILALKRADGEPLTRADIQYDVLDSIFSDRTCAFTDPYVTDGDAAEPQKLCFHDLYIKAITHSTKATKALKDKMAESPKFAEDFAILSLLVNVGRINTTMSFFPEMKTAIRTYHPIPVLQRTNGNLQDAPRVKHVLKMGLLERETQNAPQTPDEILSRAQSGHIPSTSVLNLMFVLSSHSALIGSHFSQRFDFLDVFLRTDISSTSRAQAFLWMCFNYLENPASANDDYDAEEIPNPFSDPRKNASPVLVSLTPEEILLENVDSPEEKLLAEKLVANREQIIKQHSAKGSESKAGGAIAVDEDQGIVSGDDAKGSKGKKKGGRTADKSKRGTAAAKAKKAATEKSRKESLKAEAKESQHSAQGSTPGDDMSVDDDDLQDSSQMLASDINSAHPPSPAETPGYRILSNVNTESRSRHHRYSPYRRSPDPTAARIHKARALRHAEAVPERTMLQHAWHIVTNTDPLMDSDDERGDEHDRRDYIQRLKVVSRLARRQWNEPPHALQLSVEISGS